jgi:hypothetical protein
MHDKHDNDGIYDIRDMYDELDMHDVTHETYLDYAFPLNLYSRGCYEIMVQNFCPFDGAYVPWGNVANVP